MTTTETFDLFATDNIKVENKAETKKEKEKIFVQNCENDLLRYSKIKIEESNLKTEKEMIRGRLTEIVKSEFLKKYSVQKSRPDSFYIADGKGKALSIVMDAYKKVEDTKLQALQAYPDAIETETTFSINTDILAKPGVGAALSKAIMTLDCLSEEDKKALIKPGKTVSVKKGTIDRLLTFDNYEQLFHLIEPTIQLK